MPTENDTPAPSSATLLTDGQREKIAWAVKSPNCAFCSSEDDLDWSALVAAGMARVRRASWLAPSVYYQPTAEGIAALAHDRALLEAGPS